MNTTENTIQEGLVFFKESRRLMNLARTIRKKASKNGTYNEEIEEYISSVEELAKQFAELEDEYEKGDTSYARAKYEKLKTQSSTLLEKIKKETLRKGLVGVGVGGAIFLLVKILAALSSGSTHGSEKMLESMKEELPKDTYKMLLEMRKEALHGSSIG